MMSDRERWFVYPILFLLVFSTFWTQCQRLTNVTTFNTISCNRLILNGPNAEQAAALVAGESGAVLYLVRTEDGKTLAVGHDGVLEVSGLFAISAEPDGRALPIEVLGEKKEALELMPWPKEE